MKEVLNEYTHAFSSKKNNLSVCQTHWTNYKRKIHWRVCFVLFFPAGLVFLFVYLFSFFFWYMKQTVPSLAWMKKERPHYGSEKKVDNCLKGILTEHHFACNPKPQKSTEFSSLTSAAINPVLYEHYICGFDEHYISNLCYKNPILFCPLTCQKHRLLQKKKKSPNI